MDQFSFALIAIFGVPVALIAIVWIAYGLTPRKIWFSWPVQLVATPLVLGALAAPFVIAIVDAEGEFFEDESELVRGAFGLPGDVKVNRQGDRTVRLGDCWRNAVNWRSDVQFSSPDAFDEWYASEAYRSGVVNQIADYYGVGAQDIAVGEGALDLRERDARYVLGDRPKHYSQNVRILEFYDPFVCAAIERDNAGDLSLRACDPVALTTDTGNAGRVIINPDRRDRTLEGSIYYAQGPHSCTNPLRRAVNDAMGWEHPESADPNTNMGGYLPLR